MLDKFFGTTPMGVLVVCLIAGVSLIPLAMIVALILRTVRAEGRARGEGAGEDSKSKLGDD